MARQRSKTKTKLSTWIDENQLSRADVAGKLEISRVYLDRLCRRERRPGLELALKIEKLTGIPAIYWTKVPPHSG